jgi:hypothetical protein
MVQPIPKKLLLHAVTYEEFVQDDYGSKFLPPQTIRYVRVEPKNAIARSNIRDDDEGSTILFIDYRYTTPFIRPVERSRISCNDKSYEVTKVNEFWADESTIHHIEVEIK